MQKSEQYFNWLLAVLVAGLLAICVMSVVGQMHGVEKNQSSEYAGNK